MNTPVCPTKKSFSTRIVVACFALALALSGCRVTWVPAYSDTVETKIIETAKANNRLYLQMLNDPTGDYSFEKYSAKYLEVELDINSIVLINEARKNNKDMAVLSKTVRDKFIKYKKEHQQKRKLSLGEIETYDDYMKAYWRPLLVAEQSLK